MIGRSEPMSFPAGHLLEVEDLRVEFRGRTARVPVLTGVSLYLDAGETLAVLGESGSGKSVTAQAIMGILDSPPGYVTGGQVRYKGRDLLRLPERERRAVRGAEIAMIFQDALSALNPVFSVGYQIGEMLRVREGLGRADARRRAIELMETVRIPAARDRVDDHPHQFSGGMRQRVMIAMALAQRPAVLIADEPTTALDVTVQAQIMDLLADLRRDLGMAMLLITHDLGVVADVADRIAVMYSGRIVEHADVHQLYAAPAHPYTRGLLSAVPRLDSARGLLATIPGRPPNPAQRPGGCAFHPRCPYAQAVCRSLVPADQPLVPAAPPPGAWTPHVRWHSACHFARELLDDRTG